MARPNKYDYTEADRRIAAGETAYKVAKDLGIPVATMEAHQRAKCRMKDKAVLEKLGNPKKVSSPAFGTVYVKAGRVYKIAGNVNDEEAWKLLGQLAIYFEVTAQARWLPFHRVECDHEELKLYYESRYKGTSLSACIAISQDELVKLKNILNATSDKPIWIKSKVLYEDYKGRKGIIVADHFDISDNLEQAIMRQSITLKLKGEMLEDTVVSKPDDSVP